MKETTSVPENAKKRMFPEDFSSDNLLKEEDDGNIETIRRYDENVPKREEKSEEAGASSAEGINKKKKVDIEIVLLPRLGTN